MRKWLVPISGNDRVLDNFNHWFKSPDFNIFEDSEDHLSAAYFFESVHLNGVTEIEVVIGRLKGMLELIHGAIALNWGFNTAFSNHRITYQDIYYTDAEYAGVDDYEMSLHRYQLNDIPPCAPFAAQLTYEEQKRAFNNSIAATVRMASNTEAIETLLRQISYGFDWRNLYSIWDTIAYFMGGEKQAVAQLNLDANQKSAFTGTANSFTVLGPAARHGLKGWAVPEKLMSHDDACKFIETATKAFLKQQHCPKCYFQKLFNT